MWVMEWMLVFCFLGRLGFVFGCMLNVVGLGFQLNGKLFGLGVMVVFRVICWFNWLMIKGRMSGCF